MSALAFGRVAAGIASIRRRDNCFLTFAKSPMQAIPIRM